MNKVYLKKAVIIGIPAGLISTLAVVLIRTLSFGGNYFVHLTSEFGVAALILLPIAWVFHLYRREKENAIRKAAEAELAAKNGRTGDAP